MAVVMWSSGIGVISLGIALLLRRRSKEIGKRLLAKNMAA